MALPGGARTGLKNKSIGAAFGYEYFVKGLIDVEAGEF